MTDSETALIKDIENSSENNRLVALNLALEAVTLGESGRELFESACQSLEYSNRATEFCDQKQTTQNGSHSNPKTGIFLVSDKARTATSVIEVDAVAVTNNDL